MLVLRCSGMSAPTPPNLEAILDVTAIEAMIAEEERLAEEHARRAEGWRLILRGQRFLSGDLVALTRDPAASGRNNGDRPDTNPEAVLRIVASKPTKWWRPSEIMQELDERGWTFRGKTPRKTLGATLSILARDGRLEKGGRGEYRLPLTKGQDELFREPPEDS
jgi:hypothetical protein